VSMVRLDTPPPKHTDRTTRTAALWATVIAVPVTIVVGLLIFGQIRPEIQTPRAAPTTPAAVPSTPVEMAAPKLSERAAAVCLAVTSQLPAKVRNLPPRKVTAGPEQNAAYGEPPLTVACGVARPAMCATTGTSTNGCVPLDSELLVMNRVCWAAGSSGRGVTFTTMDREIPVQVTVPASYANPAQWANEFSDTVVETDKSITEGVPSGCP
jgi:hypothetical protein